MAKILVVDSDKDLIRALQMVLGMEGYETVVANDGKEALRLFDSEHPDVVITEVSLPELDGFSLTERITHKSTIPVIILSARDSLSDRISGLKHGANDYIIKPFAIEELLARIEVQLRSLSKGGDPSKLTLGDLRIDLETHETWRGDEQLRLTPREFQLLAVFMRNPRQVLTRDQITRGAWGYAYYRESNLVDVRVKHLRGKLEQGGRTRLIQTVRGFGYALRED